MNAGEAPADIFRRYQRMQTYVGWTPADAERVAQLRPLVQPAFAEIVADFYATVASEPAAFKVITGGEEQLDRLRGTLGVWLEELFCGVYDSVYVQRRWRVGWRHVDIGLDQVFTNISLSRMRHRLLDRITSVWTGSAEELAMASRSVSQLIDLDLAIIEDAYQAEYVKRFQHAERLATIGQIAAGIAHELRNPLNVIKTSAYFLLNSRGPTPEKVREHLVRMERQVGIADAVITALSNFTRLPLPEFQTVPLRRCLLEVIEETAIPQRISVELELEGGVSAISGDREQLRIVFGNLLRNARDAISDVGQIRITAAREPERIRLEFSDTGCGIPAENLKHITEPLFTTKARGLGLGLAISRAIVDKHGGSWSVSSQLGQGTTFTLRLPVAATGNAQP